ncbi:MAG: peptidoglycan-binding protein, partial [Acidobacteria bacterium]|nr:peptidoglycan-binding protein [Acidobacteriota bacterium]
MIRPSRTALLGFALLAALAAAALLSRGASAGSHFLDSTQDAAQRTINWSVSGPMGGDARELAVDPNDAQRLLMGTIDGQIYESRDGARTWARLPNFNRPGIYIDNIIIDPRGPNVVYVAAHKHTEPGGFFKTTDGGNTWREAAELKAEALHSLTQSPSNPDILVVGSNRGVYRSEDAGETWKTFDTAAYPDIRNIESLAIDPRNPDHIYVGTWHLPWKTEDGGQSWKSIKTGMIDDSDVFAIEVDRRNPDHVIASACSGIYESKNGGGLWRKIQGIPSQSRRTRDILQHPSLSNVIFAGTTEGLWRSTDGGSSWMLTTSRQLEINSIAVHPKEPQVIYIGTNNYGVMISRDGGKNYVPSNEGYSGRRAYFILPDRERPGRVYAATINTATGGGFFFVSNDAGQTWQPSMRNMPSRLIAYSILQDRADANVIYLGTNLGLYRSADRGASWTPLGLPTPAPTPKKRPARRATPATARTRPGAAAAAARASSQRQTPPALSAREPRPAVSTSASATRSDERVKSAQAVLASRGYSVGLPDGVAGTRTVAAIRRFQADKDIPQTGRLDEPTLTVLGLSGGKATLDAAGNVLNAPVALTDSINELAYHFKPDGTAGMFAATNKGLFRADDPARGWTKVSYGPGIDERTLCISTHPDEPRVVWVGTPTTGVVV